MKKLLLISLLFISVVGYSQESYSTMNTFNNTNIITNATNSVTASMLNNLYNDIYTTLQALHYDITKPYLKDTSVVLKSNVLYRCILNNSAGAFDPLDWKAMAYADADSIIVENIRAFTDTITIDSMAVFHNEVGIGAQAVGDIALSIAGGNDVILKIVGTADTAVYVNITATGRDMIGYYATATNGTNSTVGVEGHAVTTVKTIPSNSFAGVYGQSGSPTKHNYGVIGLAITSSNGNNVGGHFKAANGGAGDHYALQLENGTDNTEHLLRTYDSDGHMVWSTLRDNGDTIFCDSISIFGDTMRVNSELFVTENIDILDDKELILSTDDTKSLSYNTNTGGIHFKSTGNEQMTFTNGITFSANTGNDGLGIYSPEIKLLDAGINIDATDAATTKIVRLLCPDGLIISAGGTTSATLSTVRLAATSKTFDFPNVSGIFAINSIFATASEVAGTGDAITIDFTPNVTLVTGMEIKFFAEAANTGAATLNIDGAGAVALIENKDLSALEGNDIVNGMFVHTVYNGTSLVIISVGGN